MTILEAKKMFPNFPIYTDWSKVGNLKTKTTLKKEFKWSDDLKPVAVFVSRVNKKAHYLLYNAD